MKPKTGSKGLFRMSKVKIALALCSGILFCTTLSSYGETFYYEGIHYSNEATGGTGWMVITPETAEPYEGAIHLPDTVLSPDGLNLPVIGIEEGAFRESMITSFCANSLLMAVGDYAFFGCELLKKVEININNILGDRCFANCPELVTVKIEGQIKNLPYQIFYNDVSLKEVCLPGRIVNISDGSFFGCCELESIELPVNLAYIGVSGFEGCSNLEEIIFKGKSLELDDYAFRSCRSLQSLKVFNHISSAGREAFAYCTSLENPDFKFGPEKFGDGCFSGCSSIMEVIFEGDSVEIPRLAFSDCSSLKFMASGNKITTIGDMAFKGCPKLESIDIKQNVNSIGSETFRDCPVLNRIYLDSRIPAFCSYTSFDKEAYMTSVVYVPVGEKPLYELSPGWENFLNIRETTEFPTESSIKEVSQSEDWIIRDNILEVLRDLPLLNVISSCSKTVYSGPVREGQQISLCSGLVIVNGKKLIIVSKE